MGWLLCWLAALLVSIHQCNATFPLYKDPEQSVQTRVRDLLGRMTLEEKVNQLLHPWGQKSPEQLWSTYGANGLGAAYLFWVLGNVTRTPEHVVQMRNEVQSEFMKRSRLGIPVSFVQETLHAGGVGATIFPISINMGCTWNTSLVRLVHGHIAASARALGADRAFSPVINVFTDPRYGRLQEGYSEDPYLTAVMAKAAVGGLQGGSTGGPQSYLRNFTTDMIATVKHFAAYGATAGGIDGSPADVSEITLRDIYLYPWRALAQEGYLRSVMAAQNMVNGRPMHSNRRLLLGVLREEWNLQGILVESDGGDCIGALMGFRVVATRDEAAALAVTNGCDQDLGAVTLPHLISAYQNHQITMESIDRAAGDVLTSKFAAGLFDHPYTDPSRVRTALDNPATRRVAREVAHQGIVLLKNEKSLLPLKMIATDRIAVIGPNANDTDNQQGGYSHAGATIVTVLQAVKSGHTGPVSFAKGCNSNDGDKSQIPEAVAAAKGAKAVVVVLGDSLTTCGEMYDRASLDLPGVQLDLLAAVTAVNPNVIVVLIHGRSVTFGEKNTVLGSVPALLAAWRPGEEGGPAVWDLITGVVNPSGKLTQAWPRSVGQIHGPGQPYLYPFQGDHMHESYVNAPSTPLFPFGYGLTYSEWKLGKFTVAPTKATVQDTLTLEVEYQNQGPLHGSQVIQIYFEDVVSSVVRVSARQLRQFARVTASRGESNTVKLSLPVLELATYDDEVGRHVVEPGEFKFYASMTGPQEALAHGPHCSVNVVA